MPYCIMPQHSFFKHILWTFLFTPAFLLCLLFILVAMLLISFLPRNCAQAVGARLTILQNRNFQLARKPRLWCCNQITQLLLIVLSVIPPKQGGAKDSSKYPCLALFILFHWFRKGFQKDYIIFKPTNQRQIFIT